MTQRSDAGEAQTCGHSISNQALYHWAPLTCETTIQLTLFKTLSALIIVLGELTKSTTTSTPPRHDSSVLSVMYCSWSSSHQWIMSQQPSSSALINLSILLSATNSLMFVLLSPIMYCANLSTQSPSPPAPTINTFTQAEKILEQILHYMTLKQAFS